MKKCRALIVLIVAINSVTPLLALKLALERTPPTGEEIGHGQIVLLLAVEDRRHPVATNDEPPDWLGERRSGFGIPYNVRLDGGRTVAEFVAETIQQDLEAFGFSVINTGLKKPSSQRILSALMRERNAVRAVHIQMKRFDFDKYLDTDVEWDFEIAVFSPEEQIVTTTRAGTRELKGRLKKVLSPVLFEVLRAIVVEDDEIMGALVHQQSASRDAAEAEGCTVDQVLAMKEAGLSDQQIKAACNKVQDE